VPGYNPSIEYLRRLTTLLRVYATFTRIIIIISFFFFLSIAIIVLRYFSLLYDTARDDSCAILWTQIGVLWYCTETVYCSAILQLSLRTPLDVGTPYYFTSGYTIYLIYLRRRTFWSSRYIHSQWRILWTRVPLFVL